VCIGWNSAIAIYGAALSTGLAAIKILEFLRDRPVVTVSLCLEARGPNDPRGPYLVTTAVNKGRRPVTIEEIGVEYANGRLHIAATFWPNHLRPPATLTESEQFKGFIAAAPLKVEDVRGGFARGSDDRLYRSPRWVPPSS